MKICVAVDAFKGSLTSIQIGKIIKTFYKKKGFEVKIIPISDGGEGFVEAISHSFNADVEKVKTVGPLGKKTKGFYVLHEQTAFIEISNICGLVKMKKDKLNPLYTTTYGLGVIIKDAILKGAKRIVLGLGGSATNDGGVGMLQALGVKFYNKNTLITQPMNGYLMGNVTDYNDQSLKQLIKGVSFEIASDVKNPLLGKQGATFTYAKQKGADINTINKLETNMKDYALLVEDKKNKTFKEQQGAGSAGGLGFASLAFLDAKLYSGINYVINLLEIEKKIKTCDVVFVGEGSLDRQTAYGKAPEGISVLAKKHQKKVIGIFALNEENIKINSVDEHYVMVPKYANKYVSFHQPKRVLKNMLKDIKL